MLYARRFLYALVFLVASAVSARADEPDDKPIVIPLDQIWAFEMLGTKDIRELEPDKFGEQVRNLSMGEQSRLLHESLTEAIRQSLQLSPLDTTRPIQERRPRAAFAASGAPRRVLEEAHRILVEKNEPQESFAPAKDISIVFFSYPFGSFVHLDHVERRGTTIEIHYRFVPHFTTQVTSHFALIPLGALPPGKYQVKNIQLPMDMKLILGGQANLIDTDSGRLYVCNPFTFSVGESQSKK